jgi:glycosyltransferase involved in cell wall biosynthesis
MDRVGAISVVIPMRNEAAHVGQLVADLAAQDYEGELEVLVADGGSSDGSAGLIERAAREAGLHVDVLSNPAGIVSTGLNACIRRATGDLIVRMDCHSRYGQDYLRRCASAAEETGAWNVGGLMVPEGSTAVQRAVAAAADSPFGGVGWTRHADSGHRVDVDTVQLGAFRPTAFERAGLFDEALLRNQDDELNFRIRQAGGRIVLDPSIRVRYVPRGTFSSLFSQYYEYGLWKAVVTAKHRRLLSARSLAPIAFVSSLAVLGGLSVRRPEARWLLTAELALYGAAALVSASVATRRRREPWSLLPLVAAVFPTLHAAYGLGTLRGLLRIAAGGMPTERPPARARGAGDATA